MRKLVRAIVKRVASTMALIRGRESSRRRILKLKPKHILVLCHGNIYRSPFVANIIRLELQKISNDYEVKSAGFHEVAGRSSLPEYVTMCKRHNVDLSAHRSTVVNGDMIEWADIVIVMDRHNWGRVIDLRASGLGKLVWIGSGEDRGSVEIEDPYKKEPEEIAYIVTRLASASERLSAIICNAR